MHYRLSQIRSFIFRTFSYLIVIGFLSCTPEYLRPSLPGRIPVVETLPNQNLVSVNSQIQLRGSFYLVEENLMEVGFLVSPISGFVENDQSVEKVIVNKSDLTLTSEGEYLFDMEFNVGLVPELTKYYRAFCKNSLGIGYGVQASFTTSAALPALTTTSVSQITSSGATTGGNVTSSGAALVTIRGVAYGTLQNPTTANNTTSNGAGIGVFTSTLTSLTASTIYFTRAYATNSVGTSYGNQMSFTTSATLPALTTLSVTQITTTRATTGGNITSDGGSTVTARGVAFGTTQNPTTADNTTIDGTGTGAFTSVLTNLIASTIYYVRAHATNTLGTAYGNEVSFTTLAPQPCNSTSTVTDIDGNLYNMIQIGTQCWTKSNLKVSKYRNGDIIPMWLSNSAWQNTTSGAFAIFNNEPVNDGLFGKLYNHYAVTDSRGLCPTGWHVPSDAEWTTLENQLGGSSVAGGALKTTTMQPTPGGWNSPNTGATNSSGFTALPGGLRSDNGGFLNMTDNGYWWSSSVLSGSNAWYRYLNDNGSGIYRYNFYRTGGFSVRCCRD